MDLTGALKRSFVAGLILLTPLVITLYVLRLLVTWSLQFVNPVVQGTRLTQYTGNDEVAAQVVAAVLILVTITLLGYLAQKNVGRQLFGSIGRIVNVIPLFSTVYLNVRQVANSLVDRSTAYESVVLVEYPREDIYSLGLVTGESPSEVERFAGQPVHNVFLPNSPNPTGGRLVLLPDDQVHELDMSVRRGLRLIVTTGVGPEDDAAALVDGGRRVE
jgi:uncharacterized membrane protein